VASNNEYKRYFIILQEDDKGYGMSTGKIPTGYVKIEVKNNKVKLNAFIQNVKLEDRIEYRLILVASGKRLAVDIGKIIIDNSGRGELSYEIESDNVLRSGINIGDFTVAAVTSGTDVPLSGYTGRDKLEWKGRYDVVNKQTTPESPRKDKKPPVEEIVPEIPVPEILVPEVPEEPIVVPEPIVPPEPIMPPPAPKPEIPVEIPPIVVITPKPEPQIIVQPPKVEIVIPKCPPMAPMEEPCVIEKEKPKCEDISQYYCDDDDDDHEHEHKHFHEEYHKKVVSPYYSGNMYSRLKKVLRRLRKYEPFEKERDYDWFKVGDDMYEINEVAVPYMGYMMPLGYPFMSEGCSMMMDRKDYIIGIKYDDEDDDDDRKLIKHILYGIPAVYSKRNEQYYKSRGFMGYIPHKSKGYGYFIMCLDLRRGTLCNMD
jgi:hypothetical protein